MSLSSNIPNTSRWVAIIQSLTPREAKLMNSYINNMNCMNESYYQANLYDEQSDNHANSHDENVVDYRSKLMNKINYIPDTAINELNRIQTMLNRSLKDKYDEAARMLYGLKNFIGKYRERLNCRECCQSSDMMNILYNISESMSHNFIHYIDDHDHENDPEIDTFDYIEPCRHHW